MILRKREGMDVGKTAQRMWRTPSLPMPQVDVSAFRWGLWYWPALDYLRHIYWPDDLDLMWDGDN